jgi:hypothetical protein
MASLLAWGARRGVPVALALGVVGGTGCEFNHTTVPPGAEQPVVHAVLNPGRSVQRVLVERTLTGRVEIPPDLKFDAEDPIVSGGGVPISGARVVVYGPTDSAVLAERPPRSGSQGTGLYEFVNGTEPAPGDARPTLEVLRGVRYHLRVTTPEGRVVTGTTTVPDATPVSALANPESFNRDVDSVFVFWDAVPLAARYQLRIESPHGPFALFVDSLEYLVSGSLRNLFAERLPMVFQPGFTQAFQIGAVDANFYDYFRSFNSPFTGSGIINHLDGGVGLFGSYVLVRYRTLSVTATPRYAFEGTYVVERGGDSRAPQSFDIYVESSSPTLYELTGNYTPSTPGAPPGLLGSYDGTKATLAFLRSQLASDTLNVLTGRLEGDVFTASFEPGGPLVRYHHR